MTTEEWDKVFAARQWGRWPNTRAVEWVMRQFGAVPRAKRAELTILEIGYGAGAQLAFLLEEGFAVHGVESSPAAQRQAEDRVAPFVTLGGPPLNTWHTTVQSGLWGFDSYDAALDICTLQHLTPEDAAETIQIIRRRLKPGACLFSIHAAVGSDVGAFGDVPEPRLLRGHQIQPLFRGFELQVGMETVHPAVGVRERRKTERRHWIIEARKPHGAPQEAGD